MSIIRLAFKNIADNFMSSVLSILVLAFGVSIASILFKVNSELDEQFGNNLGSVDMVVGAKGSPLQLILSSVYHIDNPTGNILFEEIAKLRRNPFVKSAIPVSVGDSYGGFRIVGTEPGLLNTFNGSLDKGRLWTKPLEVVIGTVVSERLGIVLGDQFKGVHGLSESEHVHESSYTVVGVLKKSNSVIDKLILTPTESVWVVHGHSSEHHDEIEHIHSDGENNDYDDDEHNHDHNHDHDLEPKIEVIQEVENLMVTSILVKFKNPIGLLSVPRKINESTNLQAAVPTFEIKRLMDLVGVGADTLGFLATIIIVLSAFGILFSMNQAMRKRKYELALIRVHGGTSLQLMNLVLLEGVGISLIGAFIGILLSRMFISCSSVFYSSELLDSMDLTLITEELYLFIAIFIIGFIASIFPALKVVRTDISKTLVHD